MSKNLPLSLFAAIALFFPLGVTAEEVKYVVDPWQVPDSYSNGFPNLDVKVGDSITFYWSATSYSSNDNYNVMLYPSLSCDDQAGKIWVGSSSGATYKFTEAGKTHHFTSDTADYCQRGMSIIVNVVEAAAPTPWPTAWVAPVPSPTTPPTVAPIAPPTFAPTPPAPTNPPTAVQIDGGQQNGIVPKEIVIDNWVIPADQQPFVPIEANVGDKITFLVNPGHDVFLHPSRTCDETGAVFIGDSSIEASYTFTETDGSPEGTDHMFVCGVGNHCDLGMQLLVTVFSNTAPQPEVEASTQTNEFDIDWFIPAADEPYAPINANVGDKINFNMGPGHNVAIHSSGNCDKSGSQILGDDATTSYTILPSDAGKSIFFACDVGSHCDLGMQIVVNVSSNTEISSSSANNGSTAGSGTDTDTDFVFEDVLPSSAAIESKKFWTISTMVASTLAITALMM